MPTTNKQSGLSSTRLQSGLTSTRLQSDLSSTRVSSTVGSPLGIAGLRVTQLNFPRITMSGAFRIVQ